MDVAEVRAELEEELSHRLEEIRFFRNQLSDIDGIDQKERFCKCLVVMLYAHFEGSCLRVVVDLTDTQVKGMS